MPHDLICDREKGYKFKADEVLAYDVKFFKRDYFNQTQVSMLSGCMAHVAFCESNDTWEDSCAISSRLSKAMTTDITKTRTITINFDQVIHNLVEHGDTLDSDSILCTIEDSVTAGADLFDDESLATLNILSANSPRAKSGGTVDKVEILYYGAKDRMSESLKRLVNQYDKKRASDIKKHSGDDSPTGELLESLMIDGKRIPLDTVVVKVLITKSIPMGVGDKGVFANQLKTTVGRTLVGVNESESGDPIDAFFAYQSVSNRIVLSPEIAGCNNTAMRVISKKFANIYFGKDK